MSAHTLKLSDARQYSEHLRARISATESLLESLRAELRRLEELEHSSRDGAVFIGDTFLLKHDEKDDDSIIV